MGASFFVTCYNRTEWLKRCMPSWSLRNDIKVVLLDDNLDGDSELSGIAQENNFHYIHTGAKKSSRWRVPGYALNIGAKYFSNEVMAVSCPEMFHNEDALLNIVDAVYKDNKAIAHTEGWLQGKNGIGGRALNTKLPFLMAWHMPTFISIGGYDEDFIGFAYEDNDLMDRMLGIGCHFIQTKGYVTHTWHEPDTGGKYEVGSNKKMYEERKGIIPRNVGKEWGVL